MRCKLEISIHGNLNALSSGFIAYVSYYSLCGQNEIISPTITKLVDKVKYNQRVRAGELRRFCMWSHYFILRGSNQCRVKYRYSLNISISTDEVGELLLTTKGLFSVVNSRSVELLQVIRITRV